MSRGVDWDRLHRQRRVWRGPDSIQQFRPRRPPKGKMRKAILLVDSMNCRWTAVWTRRPHGKWECYETSEALSWMAGAEVGWVKEELERRQLKWRWK